MSFESALLFETADQVYLRVFRAVQRGHRTISHVTVRYRKYANANSRIRLLGETLHVDISDLLENAPSVVQEALAFILVSKLCRVQVDSRYLSQYQRYLSQPHVRTQLQQVKAQRGRKHFRTTSSGSVDLNQIFERLNALYFEGKLQSPRLGWSIRTSRTTLGHYDPCHEAIVINTLLDNPNLGTRIVEFVMYHEMLHLRFPTEQRKHRRCIHSRAFKEAERNFHNFDLVQREIRNLFRSR